jgi:hypothetical protein
MGCPNIVAVTYIWIWIWLISSLGRQMSEPRIITIESTGLDMGYSTIYLRRLLRTRRR